MTFERMVHVWMTTCTRARQMARPALAVGDKCLFLHFYNSLNFHSKNIRNVFRTYFITYVQSMKQVEAISSEKFEVTGERWGSDVCSTATGGSAASDHGLGVLCYEALVSS
jgi:hypothetical protein